MVGQLEKDITILEIEQYLAWPIQRLGSDEIWMVAPSGLAVLKGLPVLDYHPDFITTNTSMVDRQPKRLKLDHFTKETYYAT